MDKHLGFHGLRREGYLMYDGTIVVLHAKPGKDGDAYYTRKSNYGLNVQVSFKIPFYSLQVFNCFQIGNVPSNLWIVDYFHGFTGC